MSAHASVHDDSRTPAREYVRHPLLAVIRPSVLAVLAMLFSLGFAHELPANAQFILLRSIELLVLVMYLWQFARNSPSFMEAAGILLIGAGFLFLIFKAALMPAAVIFIMAIAWFVMTWIAKRWTLLRGLTTLALFTVILQTAVSLLRAWKVIDSNGITHINVSLLLFCLLVFIAFASSRTWHQQSLVIPTSYQLSAKLWSTLLFVAVFAQIGIDKTFHQYGGGIVAILAVITAWKTRLWLGQVPRLRWIPPALMVMPINQVALGIYISLNGKSFWITHLHIINGYAILVLAFLLIASIWASSTKVGLCALPVE